MKYMSYESTRIIDKQEKYEKIRAYDLVESLEKSGISSDHVLCALELMGRKARSEFESAIISRAKQILSARQGEK
jgi:hypothetical protein